MAANPSEATPGRRHRRHSAWFKLTVVQAYLRGEGGLSELAQAHDISHALLRIWIVKYQAGDLAEDAALVRRTEAARRQIESLRRTVKGLRRQLAELEHRSTDESQASSRRPFACRCDRSAAAPRGIAT